MQKQATKQTAEHLEYQGGETDNGQCNQNSNDESEKDLHNANLTQNGE